MGNVLKKVGSKPPPKDLAEYIDGGRLYPYNCLYPSTSTTDPSSLPLLTHDRTLLRQLQLARRLAPFYRGLDQPADVFTLDVEENQRALQRSFQQIYAETDQKRNRAFSVQSGRKTRTFFLQHRSQSCEIVPPSPPPLPPPCTYWSASPDQETPNQPNQSPTTESRTFHWPRTLKKRRGIGRKVPKYSSSSENIRKPLITMAELYRDPVECPICLLYYPKNLNFTKCCHKPICTECFLQIHRSPSAPQVPASCPFCTRSEFGVYYVAPTFEPTDAASNSDGDLDASGGGGTSTVDGSSNNGKHAKLVKKYSSILDKICPDPEHIVSSDQLFPILAWRNALEEELMNPSSPGLEITLGEETTQHLNRRRFIFSRFRRPTPAPPVSSRETPLEAAQTTNLPSHAEIQNYVQAIQQMGIDLEQAMLTEAIRQSLGRTTGPNDHHMELTLPPPLSVMTNESATSSTDSIPLHMLQARLAAAAVRSRSLPGQI